MACSLIVSYGPQMSSGDGVLLSLNRKSLATSLRAQVAAQRDAEAGEKVAMPIYGTTVTITSTSQKVLEKLERKDKRRVARGKPGADPDLDW
jgi:hypothetical protein